ncbi:hypothetical protein Q0Z83_044570 [Actinoplanes sichuanensis]|uniref:Uncharacterized protein n=1 Tax=Actinoplanes sichuanensis TaxID=512349 RepID=A0ABW4AP76_9ACTN|nr:hypothetical protein [Actinoplanes sichuanensis]BEL06266.1 hypothetical protein Q0Z83_044570 [Actinoplanes sichuanensis]
MTDVKMKDAYPLIQRAGLDTAALTLVGFAIGCGIARYQSGATSLSKNFADTPEFAIWSAVVGFEVALRLNLFSALWAVRTEVRARVGTGCVWSAVVAMLIIAGMFRMAEHIYPTVHSGLYGNPYRRAILQVMMLVTIAPGLVSLWRIRSWVIRVGSHCALQQWEPLPVGALIADVLYMTRTLQKITVLISAVVVVSILDVAAFRVAFLAHSPKSTAFPLGLVILYGLLLTVVLSFIYLPTHVSFNDYKRHLRDALCPIPVANVPDEFWHANRDRMERLIQLPRGLWESVRTNYALLAPLIASVLSLFLPGLKF